MVLGLGPAQPMPGGAAGLGGDVDGVDDEDGGEGRARRCVTAGSVPDAGRRASVGLLDVVAVGALTARGFLAADDEPADAGVDEEGGGATPMSTSMRPIS